VNLFHHSFMGLSHIASSNDPSIHHDDMVSLEATHCHRGLEVNPANGLPMLDDCFDIMGNPYGTDSSGLADDDFCAGLFSSACDESCGSDSLNSCPSSGDNPFEMGSFGGGGW